MQLPLQCIRFALRNTNLTLASHVTAQSTDNVEQQQIRWTHLHFVCQPPSVATHSWEILKLRLNHLVNINLLYQQRVSGSSDCSTSLCSTECCPLLAQTLSSRLFINMLHLLAGSSDPGNPQGYVLVPLLFLHGYK